MPKSQVVSFVRKHAAKAAVVGTSLLACAAHAEDKYGISQYITEAKENNTLVVTGVIALAALGFGVGLLVGFLRK